MTAARARIVELQKTAAQEGQLATKIQDLEGKLEAAQESLQKEQELTAQLEVAAEQR